jgi:stage II sporulation protein D
MNKILIFMIFIISNFILSSDEKVRINLYHYSKINNFEIRLNPDTVVTVDNKKIQSNIIKIFNNEKKIVIDNSNLKMFKQIRIISNGNISLISSSGTVLYNETLFINNDNIKFTIINEVGQKNYFASVLGAEMGDGFSNEALKAIAVAVRTYFYKKKSINKNNNIFDINNADGVDMVYKGPMPATAKMHKAFYETNDLYLVDQNDKLILPLFHSTSGGIILKDIVLNSGINDFIEDPVLLKDVDDKNSPLSIDSPYFKYDLYLDPDDIIDIISAKFKINKLIDVKLKYFNKTSCVDYMGFVSYNDQIFWLKGYDFVSFAQKKGFYNLRSIQFSMEKTNSRYFIKGQGFGHLCGISQYSAEKLAEKGFTYLQIIKKYYPGYTLRKITNIEKFISD